MKNRLKKILYPVLAVIMILSLSACSGGGTSSSSNSSNSSVPAPASGKSYALKFSATDAADSVYDKMVIQPLQQKLKEKSGGRLSLEVYYSSSLSKQGQNLEAIKKGTVDMAVDILAMYAGQYPYTELLNTPSINLGGTEAFTKTTSDYAKAYPEKGLEDFVIISRFSGGTFGILSVDKPVTKASDLKGMALRAAPSQIPWFKGMGASATMIPISDLYESLKLSVIKGAYTTLGAINVFKLQEVTNYFTPLTMCGGDQVIAMSKPLYDSMPADLKAVIDEVSKEMVDVGINYIKAVEQATMDQIKKSNPKFKFVEVEDAQSFVDAGAPMLDAKAKEINGKGLDGAGALKWLESHAVK